MKLTIAASLLVLLLADASLTQAAALSGSVVGTGAQEHPVCVLSGAPPSTTQFTIVKQLKIGKGTYGSVDEGIALLADKARTLGADAIINYSGSQRFGFFPWRFVR